MKPVEGAYCYAIVKDGSVMDFTTATCYDITDLTASYQLRVANRMGGLGKPSAAVSKPVKKRKRK